MAIAFVRVDEFAVVGFRIDPGLSTQNRDAAGGMAAFMEKRKPKGNDA